MAPNSFKYIANLDGLRAIAALFVLLIHGSYGYFAGGWIGVDLFFVLSGFLITLLLENEYVNNQHISISKFYIRRILRLLPALIFCIVLANVLNLFSTDHSNRNHWISSLAALFYFTNILNISVLGNLSHLWSLSVEEHFYLFWPLLMTILFVRTSKKIQIRLLFSVILIITIIKIILSYNDFIYIKNIFVIDIYRFTFFRMDCLLTGALIGLMYPSLNKISVGFSNKKYSYLLLFMGFTFTYFLFTLSENSLFYKSGGFFIVNVLCAILVFIATKIPNHSLLSNKLLSWLGVRSYGIYIYHFPIFLLYEVLRVPSNISNYLLVSFLRFSTTILIAAISYTYIEKPFLNLKVKYAVKK